MQTNFIGLIVLSHFLTLVMTMMAIPVTLLFIEVGAAISQRRRDKALFVSHGGRPRICVIVPAHNENSAILPTLKDIKAELNPGDRLIVVADNCTDDTAAVAAAAGAEVIVRADHTFVGKGYALDFGFKYLRADPPEVVVVVDADCRLGRNTIDTLVTKCAVDNRPVQSLILMYAPDHSEINHQLAEFAWRIKNLLRPLGLKALNLPCQLSGTGVAFPWPLIGDVEVASGEIVEDYKLGLDLAAIRSAPSFCPTAIVTSVFPTTAVGAERQRERWEHGHLGLILKFVPRYLLQAVIHRNRDLLALALDMMIPPLFLLAILIIAGVLVSAAFGVFFGFWTPLVVSLGSLAILCATILLAWLQVGREILPLRAFKSIFPYAGQKFALYYRTLSKGLTARWVRAERGKSD